MTEDNRDLSKTAKKTEGQDLDSNTEKNGNNDDIEVVMNA
jgi:hypothetical protein